MTNRAGILCAGNWIVDIVHEISHWPQESDLTLIGAQEMDIGGGAANVVSALAKLKTGLPLWPMGAVGDDDFGRFVQARIAERGLPTDLIRPKPGVATAHTHVMSVPGQSRTFFYQGGANDRLEAADFPQDIFASHPARLFYLGYLTLLAGLDALSDSGDTPAAEVLGRARAAGLRTCVDLVSIDRADFAPILSAALPRIDYLFLNEVELARACGAPPLPEAPTDEAIIALARTLIARGVSGAVILHCPQKALWIGADGRVVSDPVIPVPAAEIASPLGAGDCFCAGVLYALHEGWDPQEALHLGHKVARASLRDVTATGAVPDLATLMGGTA